MAGVHDWAVRHSKHGGNGAGSCIRCERVSIDTGTEPRASSLATTRPTVSGY